MRERATMEARCISPKGHAAPVQPQLQALLRQGVRLSADLIFGHYNLAWDSVIVAPNGQILDKTVIATERGGSALLVEDVPLGPANASFTLYGGTPFQWLVYAAIIVMAGTMFRSWRRRR